MGSKGRGALALALVMGVAGCGGSSAPKRAESVNASPRAEFVKRADVICKHVKAQNFALITARTKNGTVGGSAMFEAVLAVVAREEKMVERLAAIETPTELKAAYDTYLSNFRRVNSMQRQVVRLAGPNPEGVIEPGTPADALSRRRTDVVHKTVAQAQAIGFKICGV